MTSAVVRSAGASIIVIAIWAFLAGNNPESTYHFAPVIGALSGPWLTQSTLGRQPARTAMSAVGVSLGLVLLAGFVLHMADRLAGPTFWGDGGAIVEVVLFTCVGALAGWFIVGPKPEVRFDDAG